MVWLSLVPLAVLVLPAAAQQRLGGRGGDHPRTRNNIILFGPPGVGKGTQAKAIIERHGVCHVSTGDLLRAEVAKASKIGRRVKSLMASGNLVPDQLVVRLVVRTIASTRACKRRGWLLDGFPRTAPQVHALLEAGLVPHQIIVINATNATIVARALSRARKAIAAGQTPRKDDNAVTMSRRIAEYEHNRDTTLTALRDYLRIAEVDGEGEREHVERRISQLIPQAQLERNGGKDKSNDDDGQSSAEADD